MADYKTIEQCSLEYNPERGASIEQHIDDCWVWGERIVTINLNGDSVLTLTKYLGDSSKYNLSDVDGLHFPNETPNICVRIPQPSRSLIIMYGSARYYFEHCVLRRDIKERRVCIALREFTPRFLQPEEENGRIILEAASKYFWSDVNTRKINFKKAYWVLIFPFKWNYSNFSRILTHLKEICQAS